MTNETNPMIQPGADLRGADLSYAVLDGAKLDGAKLTDYTKEDTND